MSNKEKILSAISYDTIGNVLVKFFLVSSGIIVARTLGPELLGKYSIILIFCGSLGIIVSFGMEDALVRYSGELSGLGQNKWVGRMIKDIIIFRILIVLACSVLLLVFTNFTFGVLGLAVEWYTILFIIYFIFSNGLFSLFSTFLQTKFQQKYINIVTVSISAVNFLTVVCLWFSHLLTVRSLLLAVIVFLTTKLILFGWRARVVARETMKNDTDIAHDPLFYSNLKKRFLKYSVTMLFISLGGVILAYRSDVYFISFFLGLTAVGYYNLANNFIEGAFGLVLPGSFGPMYTSMMVESYHKNGVASLNKFFQKNVEYVFLFTFPLAIGGSILARELILLFYGPAYLPATTLFILFFLISAIFKFAGSVSSIFVVLEKPHYFMWTKVISIINIPLNLLFIPWFGVMGALGSTSITLSLIFLVEYFLAKHLASISIPWVAIFKIGLLAVFMGFFTFWLGIKLQFSLGVNLFINIMLSALLYMLSVYFFKIVDREYFDFFLKKFKFSK